MEGPEGPQDVVHPEVRAHINSLVSALGGFSAEEEGQYQLGDDALEVLRDLKRWIRFYDEKTNRMDVARCLYEANLVEGDLLPILAKWPDSENDNKFRSRIALACFELMVPLTWPMDNDKERMTNNHHRHMPVLEQAQISYKRAIINFDGARILHAAVRASLPSISQPIGERSARDQGIIKLILFFLRNMSLIAPSTNTNYDGDESQISRSATIDTFSFQDIFMYLLTISSNMGEDFRTEDTAVMEILYHLLKRVEPEMLFMSSKQRGAAKAGELSAMMGKEEAMLKAYNRKGPTRHNRFGTMIWVKRDGTKMSSLSGQDALADPALRNEKMDKSKTWRPPRRRAKDEQLERDLGPKPKLNNRATEQLRSFADDFLDSGFNPLFSHIRKTIDREATHVMTYHRRQFFYLVAWFLEAERARQKAQKRAERNKSADVGSFNLVAGVLNQEMFITLSKALHEAFEMKDWHDLSAVMRCFTQILLTVQEMSTSGNEDDEEIAENILSRLFYEESTHDIITKIILSYKGQGFDFLDAATELVHHFLRILEIYSKQNIDMQVRSRKRARRKKKKDAGQEQTGQDDVAEHAGDEGSGDDEAEAQITSKERKFDFHRFVSRFTPQGAIDTFVTFTKFYQDLSDSQLKRAHRFFYRIAFKQEMSVMLFRVDIIHLLYNMIKGPQPLDKANPAYKDWEELVKQVLRKCTKKIDERPELIVEMLFSKQGSTAFFLEHGHQKMKSAKGQPKPGAELDFKYTKELDRQIAIVVGVLLDRNQSDHIAWFKKVLTQAETERRAWAAAEQAKRAEDDPFPEEAPDGVEKEEAPLFTIRPDDKDRGNAIFKNSHLRLLMTLCSCTRREPTSEESPESLWMVPGSVSAETLKDALHYIHQAEFSPPTFENGQSAEQQLKRKTLSRRRAAFDDDEEGEEEDGVLFPIGGPTATSFIDDGDRPKKAKKHRKRRETSQEPDDEELALRARKRRDKELEKARRIKSALYVQDGESDFDSDEDEAFYARERETAARARKVAQTAIIEKLTSTTKSDKKKSSVLSDSSDEQDDAVDSDASLAGRAKTKRKTSSQSAGDSETDDTPLSESEGSARKKRKFLETPGLVTLLDDEDQEMSDDNDDAAATLKAAAESGTATAVDEEEDDAPVLARRPRVRGGFIIDSSDDEDDA